MNSVALSWRKTELCAITFLLYKYSLITMHSSQEPNTTGVKSVNAAFRQRRMVAHALQIATTVIPHAGFF
jgi:hypothetical protein